MELRGASSRIVGRAERQQTEGMILKKQLIDYALWWEHGWAVPVASGQWEGAESRRECAAYPTRNGQRQTPGKAEVRGTLTSGLTPQTAHEAQSTGTS
eukprot:4324614-Prymnesium_polylepis.1